MIAMLAVPATIAMQMGHPALAESAICTPAAVRASAPTGWNDPLPARSRGMMSTGRSAALILNPAGRSDFAVPAARPAAVGGAVAMIVPRAGRWRISLDAGIWIDVVAADRRIVASVAHGHGSVCSGVRKTVEFDLVAGRYVVQLSAASAGAVRVLVTPVG